MIIILQQLFFLPSILGEFSDTQNKALLIVRCGHVDLNPIGFKKTCHVTAAEKLPYDLIDASLSLFLSFSEFSSTCSLEQIPPSWTKRSRTMLQGWQGGEQDDPEFLKTSWSTAARSALDYCLPRDYVCGREKFISSDLKHCYVCFSLPYSQT